MIDKFRPMSFFNPRNKSFIIETYLSCLEEGLQDTKISSRRYNNLKREEWDALYDLKEDPNVVIKDFIYYQTFRNGYIMCLRDQLFRVVWLLY